MMGFFRRQTRPALVTDPIRWDRESIERIVRLMVEHPDRVEWGTALATIARALDLLLQESRS